MNVLLLVHSRLIPPPAPQRATDVRRAAWRTEYDVLQALKRLGHHVRVVGLSDSLMPLMQVVRDQRPDVVFNLLEEFAGEAVLDQNIVNFLELTRLSYTGCNARGMSLARDKATAKKIVAFHEVVTPKFLVISRYQRVIQAPQGLRYPLIIKYLTEEASLGLSARSVVRNDREFRAQTTAMLARFEADLLVEEYIGGREFYVSVWGHDQPQALPARELCFGSLKGACIASSKVKWNSAFRRRHGIRTRGLPISDKINLELQETALKVYGALRLSGYARLDFRADQDGKMHFIEANPNPQICRDEDFVDAARQAGWKFEDVIAQILKLAKEPHFHPIARL